MNIFIARFFEEAPSFTFSENRRYGGVKMKSSIKNVNIVARNIISLENKKAVTHHRIRKNKKTVSRNVLGLRNFSVCSSASPSRVLDFGKLKLFIK